MTSHISDLDLNYRPRQSPAGHKLRHINTRDTFDIRIRNSGMSVSYVCRSLSKSKINANAADKMPQGSKSGDPRLTPATWACTRQHEISATVDDVEAMACASVFLCLLKPSPR